jgi:glycosyltransferase involved in cell wall biosynthesis
MKQQKFIRVSIQQPSIPTYRKPLFISLNEMFDLTLLYGFDGVPSDLPINIKRQYYPLRILNTRLLTFKWHQAQLAAINKNTDVAILSWDIQYLTLWLALLKSVFYKTKIILWGHGYSKNEKKIKRILRNLPSYFVSAILLYDYHTGENIKNKFYLKNKVFVAPNSIDQKAIEEAKALWLSSPISLMDFKKKNNLVSSFNIIYIGRIYKENKLELLIEALSELSISANNFKLIVIGKPNEYVTKLKELAFTLAIANKIIWVGECYDENSIAPWMISSHLFCYPANIGLSLMHAFGYGLPAITDDAYNLHNPEIWSLKEGFNGLVYPSNDSLVMAEKIYMLYNNESLRVELSNNALLTVSETYNITKMTEGFISAINYTT